MRSYGREIMKFWRVCLAARILELPSYWTSLASMEREMSRAIMMSTPLAFLSL